MASQPIRLPSRKWSIVALISAGVATVLISYLIAVAVALVFLFLPFLLFVLVPITNSTFLFGRLLLSAFGVAVGLTILWSLIPKKATFNPNGVPIDLAKEPRLAAEIKAIATALREPMPTEVYLLAEANAFVMERSDSFGASKRRVMGLGLPLLQMLSVAQFRAVLAHEFAHYYAGDTRLGPWVYNTQRSMARAYQNLGRKSDVIRFLTRWAIVAGAYIALMAAMRAYWKLFLRITHAISRRQEFRSDELACHVAGSEALIGGLEGIRKCQAGLNSYWSSFVVPAAMSGFQPELAGGFLRFMQAPQIVKATSDFLAQQASITKSSPYDSHPPLNKRIERAKRFNLPAPTDSTAVSSEAPMIALIDDLSPLEGDLLKKLIPVTAAANLKPLIWETDGAGVYIPAWRKQVAGFLPFLSAKKLDDFPMLVLDPRPLAALVPNPPKVRLNQNQQIGRAYDILFCAFSLCLLDNGWKLTAEPGNLVLEKGERKVDPSEVMNAIRGGKLTVVAWSAFRAERGIGNWPLAVLVPVPAAV
jgi:heat shock protein HtpX